MSALPPSPPQPAVEPAAHARDLCRRVAMASLATTSAAHHGAPYASLVAVAVDHDLTPILLLSELSDHTQNLKVDSRAALLFDGTDGIANRMAGPRVTLMGDIAPETGAERERRRRRYLARHPGAKVYEGFGDFQYFRMTLAHAHLIGGFAQAFWLSADDLAPAEPSDALMEAEADIVAHMNDDHRDALGFMARHANGSTSERWLMTGIDAEGVDLRDGAQTLRIAFDNPITDANGARKALIRLTDTARRALSAEEPSA